MYVCVRRNPCLLCNVRMDTVTLFDYYTSANSRQNLFFLSLSLSQHVPEDEIFHHINQTKKTKMAVSLILRFWFFVLEEFCRKNVIKHITPSLFISLFAILSTPNLVCLVSLFLRHININIFIYKYIYKVTKINISRNLQIRSEQHIRALSSGLLAIIFIDVIIVISRSQRWKYSFTIK